MKPGEILTAEGTIALNGDAEAIILEVANTGDRPVQVGSHFHFAETNPALDFDRDAAHGCRLDIAAGTAVRFEPADFYGGRSGTQAAGPWREVEPPGGDCPDH